MEMLINFFQRLLSAFQKPVGAYSAAKTNGGPGQQDLVSLCEALLHDAKALKSGGLQNEKAVKGAMAQKAKRIMGEVTGPEMVIPMYAVMMGEIGATYIFQEWKLFDKIPATGSISYKELAASIGGEEAVVSRIGGMLVATGRLQQTSSGHVAHGKTSQMFTSTHNAGNLFRVMFEHGLRGYTQWRDYFARYGVKEPLGPTHNPFTFSWGHPELNVWEVVALEEERARIFASSMRSMDSISGKYGGPASVYDFGWLGKEAAEGKNTERALVVDVGGSHGHTLKHIMEAVPAIPQERCVLEDRPEVIEEALRADDPALRRVQRIPHDFYEEQPVKGAMIYLLRRVLHDYSDPICIKILSRLAAALPADDPRARVLIMEQILSDPPTPGNAAADLVMFNIGGKERNPDMFAKIAGESGLKVVKIHRRPGTEVGVVECAKL